MADADAEVPAPRFRHLGAQWHDGSHGPFLSMSGAFSRCDAQEARSVLKCLGVWLLQTWMTFHYILHFFRILLFRSILGSPSDCTWHFRRLASRMFSCCCAADVSGREAELPEILHQKVLDPNASEALQELPVEEEPQEAPASAPPAAPEAPKGTPEVGSFTVLVPAGENSTLGVEVDTTSMGGPMIKGVNEGAVLDYNKLNPTGSILPFDVVTAVGKAQETKGIEAIVEMMSGEMVGDMTLTLSRPQKIQVSLAKTSTLGMKLDFTSTSVGAVVREILPSGLVASWNAEHPDKSLSANDRVIELNGQAYRGQDLVQAMKEESELLLTVLKYRT